MSRPRGNALFTGSPLAKECDFRTSVTQTLIGMLEHVDLSTFRLPWHHAGTQFGQNNPLDPRNVVTGTRYNGINWFRLALWMTKVFRRTWRTSR